MQSQEGSTSATQRWIKVIHLKCIIAEWNIRIESNFNMFTVTGIRKSAAAAAGKTPVVGSTAKMR